MACRARRTWSSRRQSRSRSRRCARACWGRRVPSSRTRGATCRTDRACASRVAAAGSLGEGAHRDHRDCQPAKGARARARTCEGPRRTAAHPPQAKALEDMVINMGKGGRLKQPISDAQLKTMLEGISGNEGAKASVRRGSLAPPRCARPPRISARRRRAMSSSTGAASNPTTATATSTSATCEHGRCA